MRVLFHPFLLYGVVDERLLFGAVIASRSDPLTWLTRFRPEAR
jgi:hypothetical protein